MKRHEHALQTGEMQMIRWPVGVVNMAGSDDEILKAFQVAPVADKMREARLRWYRHAARANVESIVKWALVLSPRWPAVSLPRSQGQLKKRLMDCLHENMHTPGMCLADAAYWM